MECFVLLLGFLFLLIMATGIGLGTGTRGSARAYEQLTRRFGGAFQGGGLLRRCSTRFRYGQNWVVVTPGSTGGRQRSTQVMLQWPDGRTDIRLETRSAGYDLGDHARQVETEDSEFQSLFRVWGQNADETRRLLSDGVRWQIRRLAESPQPSLLRISIRHGRLLIEKVLPLKRFEELEEYTQLCMELYDQAMLTRSEGIEFLGAPDEAMPLENPVCQICGEEIVNDMIYCRRCYTPHHLECWQYNGLCSTYGCRETRYSIPSVAQPLQRPEPPPDDDPPSGRITV